MKTSIKAHRTQSPTAFVPGVKNIIAVGSGKGGVGKSTVALNLAIALEQQGARVGLLDADIYGPNQPLLLGVQQQPELDSNNKMLPILAHGLQTQSMGYLIASDAPMVWRGPMVSKALQQLVFDTAWDNLDYLILDLPPGTGDVQLTLAQRIPVAGAVIVTTPQRLAVSDAAKGIAMFQKVKIPLLGIVENMSYVLCSNCQHHEAVFGQGGGEQLASQYELPLLGAIPLTQAVCECSDAGQSIVLEYPHDSVSQTFKSIATQVGEILAKRPQGYAAKFPNIKVKQD